jgi:hypothetical protein
MAACCLVMALASTAAPQDAPPPRQSPPKLPDNDVIKGHIPAPVGSETLNAALEDYSIHLYADPNFSGSESAINKLDSIQPQGKANAMPQNLNDAVSSLRWNLPPGGIVVFYDDSDLKGKQLVLWGKGQKADLNPWEFSDRASHWAWFNVGGLSTPLRRDASTKPPIGGESLSVTLTDNTIQFFKDMNFKNDMTQLSPVTMVKAGEVHRMAEGFDNEVVSAQWNLPAGVVVQLYEHADGKGERVAIWGEGQMSDLDAWNFSRQASGWSWAYIGDPPRTR